MKQFTVTEIDLSAPRPIDALQFTLSVTAKRRIADGITLFELSPQAGASLPSGGAGSHISVAAPNGLIRKYSLCNGPDEGNRYIVAIKREEAGGGGSRAIVDEVAVGDAIDVSLPRNDFALVDAERYVFVAGGIGITPIYAMIRECEAAGRPYSLYYCTRNAASCAFREELAAGGRAGSVVIHHDEGDPARTLDFSALLAQRPAGAHVYCCGPRPLMEAVRAAAAHWPAGTVHFEDFGSQAATGLPGQKSFRVRLARSGKVVEVPPDLSIMEALRRAGVDMPSSCETGTCGTCRTRLLAGTPDHRDLVLFDDELQEYIIPCVSRAASDEITLDL